MITVHHLEYSQSFRILWLLEELGTPYELKIYARDKETLLAPTEYKALSPLGTSPFISDGDNVMAETNAIIEYILDQHGDTSLRPAVGADNRNTFLFWFHASQGSLMPALTMATVFGSMRAGAPAEALPAIEPVIARSEAAMVTPRMAALMKVMEADLSKGPWFAGEQFTVADIVMSYCMEAAAEKGFLTDAHPNGQAWIKRMHDRPAFQTALKKDGTGHISLRTKG